MRKLKAALIIGLLATLTPSCRHAGPSKLNDLVTLKSRIPMTSVLGHDVPVGEQNILVIVAKPKAALFGDLFTNQKYLDDFKDAVFERFLANNAIYAAVYVDTSHYTGLLKRGAKNGIRKEAEAQSNKLYSTHGARLPEGVDMLRAHLPIVHDQEGSVASVLQLNPAPGTARFVILKKDGTHMNLSLSGTDARGDALASLTKLNELNEEKPATHSALAD